MAATRGLKGFPFCTLRERKETERERWRENFLSRLPVILFDEKGT
jgi:hypothetical protein